MIKLKNKSLKNREKNSSPSRLTRPICHSRHETETKKGLDFQKTHLAKRPELN